MEKGLFEVFPKLKLGDTLAELLKDSSVTRVTCNQERTRLWVYLTSSTWIRKQKIYELENEIKVQCFPDISMDVTAIEKFRLSVQYTPENFLEVYRDSMETELKNHSTLCSSLFHQAEISFPEETVLRMVLPDTIVARQKESVLTEYIHKIFCERCSMDLKLDLEYTEAQESKAHKNAALMIQNEALVIARNAKLIKNGQDEETHTETAGAEGTGKEAGASGGNSAEGSVDNSKADSKTTGKNGNINGTETSGQKAPAAGEKGSADKGTGQAARAGQGAQRGTGRRRGAQGNTGSAPLRRDNNPDVIYGRDFDGDPRRARSPLRRRLASKARCASC